MKTRYSIAGLGKLGAPIAAAIAKRGFPVIGIDMKAAIVEAVNHGLPPVDETGLAETIRTNRQRLRATPDHTEAVLGSDVTFVIVPTPMEPDGRYSLGHVKTAFTQIGGALSQKAGYHLVVLTSTVLPGSTRFALLPVLEAASGKKCGPDFGLCYSPEFVALGSVIRDFLNPDFTLVGEFDQRSGAALERCYREIVENSAPSKRMTLENAELAKLAVNTFVTTKIAYANMLAQFCERLPGGDIDAVSDALGLDSRIGRNYLTGGLGYGGPCFPRDNLALSALGRQLGVDTNLAAATDASNRALATCLAARIREIAPPGATVAVLGLAYKPRSDVVEESQAIELVLALAASGLQVIGYDPLARRTAAEALGDKATVAADLEGSLRQADVVVIATPDPAFAMLTPLDFQRREVPVLVFDGWRLLRNSLAQAENVRYFALGLGDLDSTAELKSIWNRPSTDRQAPLQDNTTV